MKIKKTYQGVIPNNKIVNTSSTSKTDTYSCDYTNKLHSYSTEEQVIGKWIDGKPLYRKVIEIDLSETDTANTFVNTEISIENGKIEVVEWGYVVDQVSDRYPLPSVAFKNNEHLICKWQIKDSGLLYIQNGNKNWKSCTVTVCVLYTKTTDTGEV